MQKAELNISSKFKVQSLRFGNFQFSNLTIFQSFNFLIFNFLIFQFLIPQSTYAQFTPELKSNLKQHIATLASDKFEGRGAGTKGELLAADYIAKQFALLHLSPAGDSGSYFQKFKFNSGALAGINNSLNINGKSYQVNSDFYPLSYSSNAEIKAQAIFVGYGITANDLNYDDYKNVKDASDKIFIMELSSPDGSDIHTSKYADYIDIRKKIDLATSHGAKAIIFINSDKKLDDPSQKLNSKIFPSTIPVLFATKNISKKLKKALTLPSPKGEGLEIEMHTEIIKPEKTARNVLAYIDNHAAYTIIIGAHYDHLGWHHEGSLYSGTDSMIHNGADDNASGVAGLIELARLYATHTDKNNNYLFVAFSGEESGLLGSAHYVESNLFNKEKINYMLNMDMIGRLDSTEKKLIVNGTGTSPIWASLIKNTNANPLSITSSESGVGPSDHTSFYLKDVPVLHFFSGLHMDYHKPTDDEYKINYDGMQLILKYMTVLVDSLDKKGKIAFSKTQDAQAKSTPKFSVTLGVMPDYSYSGKGLKITGVTEGKPAQKGGLLANDVITKIGEYEILDIYSYMDALSKFKKGEKTTVTVSRNNQLHQLGIEW